MENTNSAATASLFAGFFLVYAVVILAIFAFTIWMYWRILERAGYSGALSLLNLIPFGTIVCMILLAFGRWPIDDELAALRAANASRVTPGSSVMPAP